MIWEVNAICSWMHALPASVHWQDQPWRENLHWSNDSAPWHWEQPPLTPPSDPPPGPPEWQGDDADTEASFHPEDMAADDAEDHAGDLHLAGDGEYEMAEGYDQPQPEPAHEGHTWDQAEPEEEAPWETNPVTVDGATAERQFAWDPADLPHVRSDLGLQPLLRTTRHSPAAAHPHDDNLNVENVLNKMEHQPQYVPDFSQQGQYKSGWMNKCILLVALWKERRFRHLEDVCNRFAGHHSISHNVRCLQSHIRKHGDKGPVLMGYRY